jgi:IS5 family transposase
VQSRGGAPRIALTAIWGRPGDDMLSKLRLWNRGVQGVRCRIEKVVGVCKLSYALHRMRWRGLAKATLQVRLAAIAYNLKRGIHLNPPHAA